MIFGFNDIEIYNVAFEVFVEDKLINKQDMQAPKELLIMNFMQTVNQIARDKRPLKIRMSMQEAVFDDFENKEKVLTNEIIFSNNAMIIWEENKQKEYKQ